MSVSFPLHRLYPFVPTEDKPLKRVNHPPAPKKKKKYKITAHRYAESLLYFCERHIL